MARSALATKTLDLAAPDAPPFLGSLLVGGVIGLVSGVTGVGGGIFLAPLVLSLGWATTRQTAAISVVFNLVNSAAGGGSLRCGVARAKARSARNTGSSAPSRRFDERPRQSARRSCS
jgi:uncharacterized membrane protein YfcA